MRKAHFAVILTQSSRGFAESRLPPIPLLGGEAGDSVRGEDRRGAPIHGAGPGSIVFRAVPKR